MLGIEPKAVRITWSVLLTIGLVALLYFARRTILIFLVAIFFAYLLSPVLRLVDRFARGRVSRPVLLALLYVLLIGVLISGFSAVAFRASEEAASLVNRMPDLAKSAHTATTTPLPPLLDPIRGKLLDLIQDQVEHGLERALPLMRGALSQLIGALNSLIFIVLVPIISFFFLKDGSQLRLTLLDVFGRAGQKRFAEGLIDDIHGMLGQYIRALFLLSLATFFSYWAFFELTALPYAALLATVAAVLELIPVLGPLSAGAAACLVAMVSGFAHLGWLVAFLLVYRLFQDYVLQPFLMSSGVELHPLLVIFGALAGEQVAGIAGLVFSVPVLATLRLIYVRSTRRMPQ